MWTNPEIFKYFHSCFVLKPRYSLSSLTDKKRQFCFFFFFFLAQNIWSKSTIYIKDLWISLLNHRVLEGEWLPSESIWEVSKRLNLNLTCCVLPLEFSNIVFDLFMQIGFLVMLIFIWFVLLLHNCQGAHRIHSQRVLTKIRAQWQLWLITVNHP